MNFYKEELIQNPTERLRTGLVLTKKQKHELGIRKLTCSSQTLTIHYMAFAIELN